VAVELVRVFSSELTITNVETGELFVKDIDFIFYISLDSLHRLIVLIPIIGTTKTPWKNARLQLSHKNFLALIQENFEEIKVKALHPYFDSNECTAVT
jgi:hypothetical protein